MQKCEKEFIGFVNIPKLKYKSVKVHTGKTER